MTHASGVASSSAIFGDLVNMVPPMLHELSITGVGMRFSLPRTDTHLSDVAPVDTTHGRLLILFGIFPFFDFFYYLTSLLCRCLFLLLGVGILLRLELRSTLWSLLVHKAYVLFY